MPCLYVPLCCGCAVSWPDGDMCPGCATLGTVCQWSPVCPVLLQPSLTTSRGAGAMPPSWCPCILTVHIHSINLPGKQGQEQAGLSACSWAVPWVAAAPRAC